MATKRERVDAHNYEYWLRRNTQGQRIKVFVNKGRRKSLASLIALVIGQLSAAGIAASATDVSVIAGRRRWPVRK